MKKVLDIESLMAEARQFRKSHYHAVERVSHHGDTFSGVRNGFVA